MNFCQSFRSEDKGRIGDDAIEPECGVIGAQRLVEGGIDFDGIEEFGEVGCFVKLFGATRGIDVASPVGVRPACGANTEAVSGLGRSGSRLFHEMQAAGTGGLAGEGRLRSPRSGVNASSIAPARLWC